MKKLTPEQRVMAELIYETLYKHVDNYYDENGRIKVIYAGERLPMVSDNPNQLDTLVGISEKLAEQILTAHTEPEDEIFAKNYRVSISDGESVHANTEPEDDAKMVEQFCRDAGMWEKVENNITLKKIEEFTVATRERYEQVDEIPLLYEFSDWLQQENK